MTSPLISSIAERVSAIESTLGIDQNSKLCENKDDLETRINNVQDHTLKKILSHGNGTLRKDLKQCQILEKELDPGSLLTYQMMSSSSTN